MYSCTLRKKSQDACLQYITEFGAAGRNVTSKHMVKAGGRGLSGRVNTQSEAVWVILSYYYISYYYILKLSGAFSEDFPNSNTALD